MRKKVLIYTILTLLAIVWIMPVIGAGFVSLKTTEEVVKNLWAPPKSLNLSNFEFVLTKGGIGKGLINSIIITGCAVALTIGVASLAAYAFARMRFPGDNLLFFLLIGTIIIPAQVFLVPIFKLSHSLGIYNTYLAVILAESVFGLPLCTFIQRNFFATIPWSLQDAARIDGLSDFQIYLRIILPLSKPVLAAAAIIEFTYTWNGLLWGLILTKADKAPITVALLNLKGRFIAGWTFQCAGALISIIPTLVIFLRFQRYFVRGITKGAEK